MERQIRRGDVYRVVINGSNGSEAYPVVVENSFGAEDGDHVQRLKEVVFPPEVAPTKDGSYVPEERVVVLRELSGIRSMEVWEGDIESLDGLIRFEKVEPANE
ncbi:MAG: hypothetical protein PHQ59_00435 [Candidatus Daviesbacteria bacterium]|nr:hypothetical protein [Candidatus Daviesbacteria bacterium]